MITLIGSCKLNIRSVTTGNSSATEIPIISTPVNNVNPVNTVVSGTGGTARAKHTVTALPNGKILIVGGVTNYVDASTANYATALATAFLFDPIAGTFTATTNNLTQARAWHTAVYMPNVNKVLVSGGYLTTGITTDTAESYDVATGLWSAASVITNGPRVAHSMTYIPSIGKVLLVGGDATNGTCPDAISELYDPIANTWTNTLLAPAYRFQYHDGVVLSTGKVLIGGGTALSAGRCFPPAPGGSNKFMIFDPVTESFATASNSINTFWYGRFHTLADANGTVVIYARCAGIWCTENDTNSYDPVADSWTAKSWPLPIPNANRWGEASVKLANDVIYRLGGENDTPLSTNSIYTFTHSTDTWALSGMTLGTAVHELEATRANAGLFSYGGIDDTFVAKDSYFFYKPYDAINLVTTGGTPPYTYSVTSGKGSVNIDTGVFYPGVPETATITVTDSLGATNTVNVTSN